jgi:RNA polymerase sigma-70 factor (ECF subfamily)
VATEDELEAQLKATDPDVRLMFKVRDRDDHLACQELVERYQNRVVGILYHMVGDEQEAEDLAQEVFLRVYRARKGYKANAKFSTWLFTIVNRLALNAIRDKKRKPVRGLVGSESGPLGERPLEQLAVAPSGAHPTRQVARTEIAGVVREAIQSLSEDQRMAVMLNKYEDMNYRQIGQVMNKSEMAVKSLLSRARTALRGLLEPYLESGDVGHLAKDDR